MSTKGDYLIKKPKANTQTDSYTVSSTSSRHSEYVIQTGVGYVHFHNQAVKSLHGMGPLPIDGFDDWLGCETQLDYYFKFNRFLHRVPVKPQGTKDRL